MAGAASLEVAAHREPTNATRTVGEEQVALSAWAREDADTGLTIIGIMIAVFALVVAVSSRGSTGLSTLISVVALMAIGLGIIIASDRHSAAAAAAVIEFRAQRQQPPPSEEKTPTAGPCRRALIEVKINRRPR